VPLLAVHNIQKSFPGVRVLKGVTFEVRAGEVHALVGENGAGKSTLMNILAGVHKADGGTISFDGREGVSIADERAAQRLGIAIVFQERSLFATLGVAENIFAARQPVRRFGRIDRAGMFAAARALLDRLGLGRINPATPVGELSPAEQQMVEIAKALSLDAKLMIFDEPTAALTQAETDALFRVIDGLRAGGVGVIYISHRLEEIFRLADRVTVLRDGEAQGTLGVRETNADELVRRMVGREVALHRRRTDRADEASPALLEVRGLTDAEELRGARPFLRDVSFGVRAGEIVALAGLAGAGRTELALSIFGMRPRAAGEIFVGGRRVEINSPADAIRAGLGYAPEDRKELGLFLDRTIAENIAVARLDRFGSWWLDDRRSEGVAEEFRRKLRVACRGPRQTVGTLSGGNQQKVVLAKWLLAGPRVLIVDEPTRGIDVGAKAEVHELLFDLAREGRAVVVISSDLPEVLAVADRVVVMREGRVSGELDGREASEEGVMRLASVGAGRAEGI
jgi:ABC-type sugar transport system ATPase subunit